MQKFGKSKIEWLFVTKRWNWQPNSLTVQKSKTAFVSCTPSNSIHNLKQANLNKFSASILEKNTKKCEFSWFYSEIQWSVLLIMWKICRIGVLKFRFNKNPLSHEPELTNTNTYIENDTAAIRHAIHKHNPTTCQKGSLITNISIHDPHTRFCCVWNEPSFFICKRAILCIKSRRKIPNILTITFIDECSDEIFIQSPPPLIA